MTADVWAVWGMLGCLALGYLVGRRDHQRWHIQRIREILWRRYLAERRSEELPPGSAFVGSESDSAAVERLIRETRR